MGPPSVAVRAASEIRLVDEIDSDDPMHHSFHIHGAGRFLLLSRDGITEANLVWEGTVLIWTGQTVDILLDVTNPAQRSLGSRNPNRSSSRGHHPLH